MESAEPQLPTDWTEQCYRICLSMV